MALRPLSMLAMSLLVPLSSALAVVTSELTIAPPRAEATPTFLAQRPSPPEGGDQPDHPPEPPWQQLNLSADQQERIQAIHEQERTKMESLHQQMEAAEEQMRSLLGGGASSDQLRQQHQQIQSLRQQFDDQNFETMLAVREVLTSEQRTQLASLMQQHRREPMPRPPQ